MTKAENLGFLLSMALLAVFTSPWCSVLKLTLIDSLCVWHVFYELAQLAVVVVVPVAATISYIHQFSSLSAIWLCISSFVASFLIYSHNMDTIIRPISRRFRILDIVFVLWNNGLCLLVSSLCGVCIYLCKSCDFFLWSPCSYLRHPTISDFVTLTRFREKRGLAGMRST